MTSEHWDRRYAGSDRVWSAEPNVFVAREAADLPAGRALDLATGEGRNAVWLAERGWRVTAVDFSAAGLAKARREADGRGVAVDWIHADLLEYEPPARAFDLVVYAYLHLPAEERRAVLRRAADALAPGGTLLVVGHDLANVEHGWGGPQDPAVLFTPDDVVAELPGLEIERAERVIRHVVTDDDGEADAIDALVRARRPERPATGYGRPV